MRSARTLSILFLLFLAGCDGDKGLNERRGISQEDAPSCRRHVRRDIDGIQSGVRQAAERMARGFLVEDPQQREREMRSVLIRLRQPPRGISELMVSPASFVAVVGTDGHVIARDATEDRMRGFDLGAASEVVRDALRGRGGYGLAELPAQEEGQPASVTILFAAPARHHGDVVGAVVAGLPLWRLSQQLSNQLRLEHADPVSQGLLVWATVYRGDQMHPHAGFPADLLQLVPSAADRERALSASPGGYTGELAQYGRWYGYGVMPMPSLGEDMGVILFRSDPM
ncbi:MAG: hypothetical protein K8H88_06940 [Sandaracinaceae bacterium]|nr:hypothetical protein [Sandaracinaceae bacterium]